MDVLRVLSVYEEICALNGEVKEIKEHLSTLERIGVAPLNVSRIDGFWLKLNVKVSNSIQFLLEKLNEKKEEVDKLLRFLMMLNEHDTKSLTFSQDLMRTIEFCTNLKEYLNTDIENKPGPSMNFHLEMAIRRLANDAKLL